jgi:3-oxoacyl-[acyl-carrier protein] reductase
MTQGAMTQSAQRVAIVTGAARGIGAPTVLINNAGVTRDNLLFKMTDADWDTVMGVHLRGSFLMSRAVQKHMVEAKWGRIVNLSSTSALGNRGQANYSTAKAGLQGFTKTLAIELGKFGVTANCIAPGFIVSDMTKATAERIGEDWDTYVEARAAQIPVARAGQPEDIAHMAAFFVSEGAGFVSGQVIYVAGGPKA